jgi:hypothetical protein
MNRRKKKSPKFSQRKRKHSKTSAPRTIQGPDVPDFGQQAPNSRLRKGMKIFAVVALFFMGLVFGIRKISSPDVGFHLQTARWILQHGWVPHQDIFTYTVPQNTYIDLQWIFQLVVYGIEKLSGPDGIIILTTVLTLIFGATLLFRVYRKQGRIPIAGFLMLGLFFLGNLWEVRPHLFSWIWGSLVFLVLEEHSRGTRKWLPFLPVLMLLWVNSHSLFILGLVGIAAYVFSDIVQIFGTKQQTQLDKPLLLWSLFAFLVCFLNPYFYKGVFFPISQFFLIQGTVGYKDVLTGTSEFLSPFRFQGYMIDGRLVLIQPLLWWQVFTGLSVIGIFKARKSARLAEWILFAGFLFIFYSAQKNFGYFVMAVFPVAVEGLGRMEADLLRKRWWLISAYGAGILASLLLTLAAATNWLYDIGWLQAQTGRGYHTAELPVGACRFINHHGINGRIINSWNDGGFIGWTTGQKVFINSEGNTMGLSFYDSYVKAREPQGFEQALRKWEPTVAFVRYRITPYWLYYLYNVAHDWRMVYTDDHVALFLHESVAPDIAAVSPAQEGSEYPFYERKEIKRVIKESIKAGQPGFLEWVKGSRAYPLNEMQRSAYYLHTNQVEAAIGAAVAGLEKASFLVPELMLNLGHALNTVRDYDLADWCYDAFLSVDDDPVLNREIFLQRQNR